MPAFWQFLPGFPAAKKFAAQYPTPRAWRAALKDTRLADLLTPDLASLWWDASGRTIGDALALYEGEIETATLWSIIHGHARDHKVWTAPDGTKTFLEA